MTERVKKAVELVLLDRKRYRPSFPSWLAENWHVFEEFERRALNVARFREHYSARTIAEVMRHDSAVGELGGEYKINNNMVPDLALLFVELNPGFAGLFEFRREAA